MNRYALALAIFTPVAHAGFITGNDLYAMMQNPDNKQAALGYVAGVFDMTLGTIQCAPGGVSTTQMYDLVKLLLEKNPQHRNLDASDFIAVSLQRAFPCPKRNNADKEI